MQDSNYPSLQAVYDRLTVLEVDGKYRAATLDRLEQRIKELSTEIVAGRAADIVKAEARDTAMGMRIDALSRSVGDLQSEIKDAKSRVSVIGWMATKGGPIVWAGVAVVLGWIAAGFWPHKGQ